MEISIRQEYKYSALQMAAEAFLVKNTGEPFTEDDLVLALLRGNDHNSKFSLAEAQDFALHWKVVDQEANTGTGFSGTLFECILSDPATGALAGEKVLSFRSTEFVDDGLQSCWKICLNEIYYH